MMHLCTVATLCFFKLIFPRNYYNCDQDDKFPWVCVFKSMYLTLNVAIVTSNYIFLDVQKFPYLSKIYISAISKMPQHIHIFSKDRFLKVVRVATKKCANNTFERLNVVSCRERSCRENRRHWNSVWESEQRISRQIIAASKLQRCKYTEKKNKNRQLWNRAFIRKVQNYFLDDKIFRETSIRWKNALFTIKLQLD